MFLIYQNEFYISFHLHIFCNSDFVKSVMLWRTIFKLLHLSCWVGYSFNPCYQHFRFNLFNVTADQYCNTMQDTVIDAMEGVVDTITRNDPRQLRRVATYGNSDPLIPGDWVQILREAPAPTTVSVHLTWIVGKLVVQTFITDRLTFVNLHIGWWKKRIQYM